MCAEPYPDIAHQRAFNQQSERSGPTAPRFADGGPWRRKLKRFWAKPRGLPRRNPFYDRPVAGTTTCNFVSLARQASFAGRHSSLGFKKSPETPPLRTPQLLRCPERQRSQRCTTPRSDQNHAVENDSCDECACIDSAQGSRSIPISNCVPLASFFGLWQGSCRPDPQSSCVRNCLKRLSLCPKAAPASLGHILRLFGEHSMEVLANVKFG